MKRKKQEKKSHAHFVKNWAWKIFPWKKNFFEFSSDQKLQKPFKVTHKFYFIVIKGTFLCQIDNFSVSMSNCGFLKKTSKHWGFYSHFEFFCFFFFQVEKKTQKFYFFIFFCRIFTKNFLEKVYNIPERFSKGFEPKINAPARIGQNSKFGQFFQLNAFLLQMIPKFTIHQIYMPYKSYFGLVKKF